MFNNIINYVFKNLNGLGAILVLLSLIAVLSIYFLGPNNPIEKVAEDAIAEELHLPPGSVDLTPSKDG